MFLLRNNLKKADLRLEKDGLKGNKKTFQKDKNVNISIQEIKHINVKSGFIDFLVGGRTVEVVTTSGVEFFRCVQNADEIKAKTLGLKNLESKES